MTVWHSSKFLLSVVYHKTCQDTLTGTVPVQLLKRIYNQTLSDTRCDEFYWVTLCFWKVSAKVTRMRLEALPKKTRLYTYTHHPKTFLNLNGLKTGILKIIQHHEPTHCLGSSQSCNNCVVFCSHSVLCQRYYIYSEQWSSSIIRQYSLHGTWYDAVHSSVVVVHLSSFLQLWITIHQLLHTPFIAAILLARRVD